MGNAKDMIGRICGRLTVVTRNRNAKNGAARWICNCSCGNQTTVLGYMLRDGTTKSCGCLHRERVSKASKIHGHSRRTAEYKAWQGMRDRCNNPNNKSYFNYGGRGIKICKRWDGFINFLQDMGKRPDNKRSLDRIDNNLGYGASNCRWATREQQNRNKRTNLSISFNGKKQCLQDWAEEFGINGNTLWYRIVIARWPIEKALTTPLYKGYGQ